LAMLSSKHVNMHVMILNFLLVLGRLVWRPFYLCCKKQLHGLRSSAKGTTNGIGHAFMLGSPIKNWKHRWILGLLIRWFHFRKPQNIAMPSIYFMGGKKFNNYKVVCQMHTQGQFLKWLLKLCFLLWNKVSSIKLEDIGYFLMP
jgi:hypothetical protein